MAKPPGLRKRGGSWEIRKRVPDRLRSVLPTEIVKSFGGVSTREAYRLGWMQLARIEQRFEAAEVQLGLSSSITIPSDPPPQTLSEDERINIARRFLADLEATSPRIPLDEETQRRLSELINEEAHFVGQPNAVEDATLQDVAKNFATKIGLPVPSGLALYPFLEAIREAWLEHLARQSARLTGENVRTINPAFASVDADFEVDAESPTLAESIQMYIDAPERSSNSASSRKMDRSRLRLLRELLGPTRRIRSINRADMRYYRDQLIKLPAHYAQRYSGLTLAEAISAAEADNAPSLSPTTIKRNLEATRSFFGWAERQELVDKNPALHVEGPRPPKKSQRRPFTPSEMMALLKACPRGGLNGKDAWTYWCTRIAMLQGFRVKELLGLQVQDLIKRGNVWVFRLQPNEIRGLKTEATQREVPVHPKLLELGILELIDGRKPDDLLIPGVRLGDGNSLEAATKHMMRVVRKYVSRDPNLTFHSMRHSFRDAMRDGCLPRGIEERLGGWKSSGNDVMEGYGRGHRLEALLEWLEKVEYPGVEID